MDARDLRHAYAVLELSPPLTEARLKRRYKALVRLWHPDRYQADPVGQAEATQRLRDINIAYDVVTASLTPSEPEAVVPPADVTDRPFSWSPERIDAMVDSINQMNRIAVVPEMSVQRWLSVGVVVIYLVATIALLPRREINQVVQVAFYLLLPLYLIWTESLMYRIFGWLFMAAPAAVILFWIAV